MHDAMQRDMVKDGTIVARDAFRTWSSPAAPMATSLATGRKAVAWLFQTMVQGPVVWGLKSLSIMDGEADDDVGAGHGKALDDDAAPLTGNYVFPDLLKVTTSTFAKL